MWQLLDLGKMHWKYPEVLDSKCSRNEVLDVFFSLPTDALFSIPFAVF